MINLISDSGSDFTSVVLRFRLEGTILSVVKPIAI